MRDTTTALAALALALVALLTPGLLLAYLAACAAVAAGLCVGWSTASRTRRPPSPARAAMRGNAGYFVAGGGGGAASSARS